jgi:hypothetical protein
LDRRPRRDGTSLIYIQYCHSSEKRVLLSTLLAIPPRCWNKKAQRISPNLPEEYGKADQLNSELQRMIRSTEDIVAYAANQKIKNVREFVKMTFSPEFLPSPTTLPEKAKEIAQAKVEPAKPIWTSFIK